MPRLRYAFRSLARAPLLSLVIVVSIGLGIGANTAIFSLLRQVLLANLPVPHPEQLALLTSPQEFKHGRASTNDSGNMNYVFSYPFFRELEKNGRGVASLAAFRDLEGNIAFAHQSMSASMEMVSGRYFETLGVQPLLGRAISAEDDRPGGGNAVAVLGYGYWRDQLGARTDVLNQIVRVNAQPFTVVGVAPQGFDGTTLGRDPAVFVPISFQPLLSPNWNGTTHTDDYWIYLFARLQPGVTRQQAAAALNATYAGLVEEDSRKSKNMRDSDRERYAKSRLSLQDGSQGHSGVRSDTRVPLFILMGATVMVLLIAMANAANLLLSRSAARRRELAIRSAIGAGRAAIMRQLLTEALLLAAAGGAAGIALGAITLKLLVAHIGGDEPIYSLTTRLEWPVLLFALGLAILTGFLFGLYPAWDGARASVAATLKDESGRASATGGSARIRKGLVCAQVMISAMLLIPTGLFLKSLVNLLHVDLGINSENVVGFRIEPALNGYKLEQSRALFERAEAELAAIPGVRSVTAALVPLIAGDNWGNSVKMEGRKQREGDHSMYNEISPGYFGKMGIPLISGRDFTERDNAGAPKVAIVNQTFVRKLLDGRNPLGLHFDADDPNIEIVGVVRDSHYSSVKQEVPPVYYAPWRQDNRIDGLCFYVRSAVPSAVIIPQIRRVMRSLDPDLPLAGLRTLDDQIRRNIRNDRIVLQLAAVFAILATVLAMLGLYGVMAHSVARRTREIGIRMALGAQSGGIRRMVLREMLWILAVGLATGIPAALALSRLTESQLYGVKTYDAAVVAAAALALAATALAAAYLPARRASRVSPINALRHE